MVRTVERNANVGTDNGWGNPEPPDWVTQIEDLPCRAWTGSHITRAHQGTIVVVTEVNMLVPLGTDVTVDDRVVAVTSRGETIFAGPLAVHAVLVRRDHLELILAKAARA